jgi:hypothetical protein
MRNSRHMHPGMARMMELKRWHVVFRMLRNPGTNLILSKGAVLRNSDCVGYSASDVS